MGVFLRVMEGLAAADTDLNTVMTGATYNESAPHGFKPAG
jgi:hypothetical protein